ncbi:MAG: UDP-N-acetylgalactosamine-undecaprenyl-phosphate N-acetylgalactosaminephosphotransferase [bacterium]|nr:UDP-N-acetylgalactosamine-undecaprenyl-phosphate N-acetylgalactosaminephosphotransferase [bacterium]
MQGISSVYQLPEAVNHATNGKVKQPWYENAAAVKILGQGVLFQSLKRTFDVLVCLAAMPVILPVLLLCCLAVRIDSPGPIFFFQLRTGRGGKRFKMYKLRTMVRNAEELKEKYMHLNLLTYPDFKIANDPRITRVGRFLRKTSLDELPQIFNVLRGDMTLVGPRPTSFKASTYSLWHTARLELKPGLTGLWQVCGRNELDFDERVRLDIAYLRNQCMWLDWQIMFRTVGAVFTGRGAN